VISQLLFALPAGPEYRIIIMERPLEEVVASQAEMIRRRGTSGAAVPQAALIAGLRAHLNQVNAWLGQRRELLIHRQEYHHVLRDSLGAARNVQSFLGIWLDVEAMARQVDPSLYRNRTQCKC